VFRIPPPENRRLSPLIAASIPSREHYRGAIGADYGAGFIYQQNAEFRRNLRFD